MVNRSVGSSIAAASSRARMKAALDSSAPKPRENISALPRLVCSLSRWLAEVDGVAAADLPSPVLSAISMALPRCEIASWKAERRMVAGLAPPFDGGVGQTRLREVM